MMHFFLRHRLEACIRVKRGIAALTLLALLIQATSVGQISAFNPLAIEKAEAAAGIYAPINYQGRITSINGTSVANGKYNIRFKIFTAATGGSPSWTETWDGANQVTMTGGLFSVPLGTQVAMTGSVDFNTNNLFLQIEFDPLNAGTYTEVFTPRRQFGSVPYAHNSDTLDGLDSSKFLRKDIPDVMSGTLTVKPNNSAVLAIKAIGTMSGTSLHADQNVSASGNVIAEGTVSGANLYAGTSIRGAGLTNCNTATSALQWDSSSGRFSCGTITGSSFSTGNVLTIGNAKYVSKQGDTMTGALTINMQGGNLNTIGLKVINTLSGAILHAEKLLTSSGRLVVVGSSSIDPTVLFRNIGGGQVFKTEADHSRPFILYRPSNTVDYVTGLQFDLMNSTNQETEYGVFFSGISDNTAGSEDGYFRWDLTQDGASSEKMRLLSNGSLGIGTTAPKTKLEVVGTISGTTIYANQALRSSGSITAEGAISGATLYAGTSIKGAGLVSDCNTSTSALQWSSSTGRFSCGTMSVTPEVGTSSFTSAVLTIGGARYVELKGDSMTGSLQTPSINLSGVLLTSLNGFNEALNLNNAGLAINSITRIDSAGNLTNIGSIQSGEIHATMGGTFAAKVDYTTGTQPYGVAIGDLNGDGKADLAVANSNSTSVSVFINTGTGTYRAKVDYTTGTNPYGVAINDLNGDGKADLAVANRGSSSISIFLNAGNGTFGAKVDYTTGTSPEHIAIADLNRDGKADLAVAQNGDAKMSVFINNGNGTFAARVEYTTGTQPTGVAAGDLNGDGKVDLAVANYISNTVSVFINNGNGTFATKVDYAATSAGPHDVVIGDLNGDGKADLAVAGYVTSKACVFMNNGDGTFAAKVDYTTGSNPFSIAIGDLNGDGKADLATANQVSNSMSTFLNKGNGTFATKVDYTTGSAPLHIAIGDLNGDGRNEVVTANFSSTSISVFTNNIRSILYASAGTGGAVGIGTSTPGSKLAISGSVLIGNNIRNTSADAGLALEAIGTISGTTIYANQALRSSGSITAEGAISGATLYAGTSIKGAGLTDCNTATSALQWTASTGRFSCGTISAGGTFSTGNVLTIGNAKYVSKQGDTMTGALVISIQGGTLGSLGLRVLNTISGAIIHAEKALTSSGQIVVTQRGTSVGSGALVAVNTTRYGTGAYFASSGAVLVLNSTAGRDSRAEHILFGYQGNFDVTLSRTAANTLSLTGSLLPGSTNRYDLGSSTQRWRDLYLSGSSLHIGTSGNEATVGYNTAGSYFIVGTSSQANAFTILNSNGFVGIGTNNADTKLEVIGTISGSTVYANNAIRSSGSITAEGAISGATLYAGTSIKGAGLVSDCNTSTSALQWSSSTGRFSCGTMSVTPEVGTSSFTSAVLTIGGARYVELKGDSMTGSLQTPSINLSGVLLTSLNGHNEALNLNNAGLATNGITRLQANGNLTNIGSIQSGEMHARMGGTFANKVDYTTDNAPAVVIVADLNGDGKQDMAAAYATTASISVYLNTGTGSFASRVNYTVGSGPYAIITKDFNGDGRLDLASINSNDGTMSVLLNTGNGTFGTKTDYTTGVDPYDIASDDVNRDGKPDIVVLNYTANNFSVFLNKGNGTFASKVDYSTSLNGRVITMGDFNGDGYPDIASASVYDVLYIYLNKGNGTFASAIGGNTIAGAGYGIASGDVTGDGKTDIVVANRSPSTMSVFVGIGNGTFVNKVDYATGTNPQSIKIGDVNGDGKADVVTANNGGTSMSVLLNKGNGTFQNNADMTAGSTPRSIAMGDLNNDGMGDLVVANGGSNTLSVFFNTAKTILYAAAGTGGVVGIGTATPGSKLSVSGSVIINANGNIRNTAADAGVALEAIGTISGTTLYANQALRSSGSITAEGAISGATLYAGTSIKGAGLTDCNTATSALQWTASTGRFSCGTISAGGTFSTGNVLTIGNAKYVSKQGDTMTGALVIKVSTTTQTGALTVTNITRRGTGAYISSSGSVLVLNSTAGTPGSVQSRHILFGYAGTFDTALWRSAAETLSTNGTFSGAILHASTVLRSSGSLIVLGNATIRGTLSGSIIHAEKSLTSSGSITAEGAISGATLYAGTSIKGAGLVDCSTAGTSKLLWNSATGRFSCGTDTDTNTTYTAGQGLSLNGTIVTLNSSISGSLVRFTTVSGSTVFARNLLASSGSVSIEGNLTGATINGFGLQSCNGASQKLLWNTATGKFECGADVDTDTNTTYTAGRGLGLNGTSFSLNATITGSLVRFTTVSGSALYGKDSVNSSGSITAEGAISGSTLYAGTSIKGAGLTDCSTAETSKLLWSSATGRFSCGTDQTGGGSSTFSTGNVLTIGNAKYVSKQGDTMTGALNIRLTTTTNVGLNVMGTMSGRSLQVTGTGSSPLLYTDVKTGKVGINTATPGYTLDISATNPGLRLVRAGTQTGAVLSRSGNILSLTNMVTMPGGAAGNAVVFDGSNDYVAVGDIGATVSAFTIEFWGKRNTVTGSFDAIMGLNSTAYKNSLWVYENGNMGFGDAGGVWSTWNSVWTDKTDWHHVVVAVSSVGGSSSATLYFDSVSKGSITVATDSNLNGVRIGDFTSTLSSPFYGSLDEVRIYNVALTQTDVNNHYNSGVGTSGSPTEGNIIAGWHFDEGTGTNAADYTSGNHPGTLTLGPTWATGKAPGISIVQTATVFASIDGVDGNEAGITKFGHTTGGTWLQGKTLRFYTNTLERARFSTGGQLGLGTTTPGSTLSVSGSTLLGKNIGGRIAKSTVALEVIGGMSGSFLSLSNNLNVTGAILSVGNIKTRGTLSGAALNIMNGNSYLLGNVMIGSSATADTKLEVAGTISGSVIYAANALRSSGSITAEGAISGSTLYAGTSIKGAGLVSNCNTAGSSALQWTASTGRFSCGSMTGTFSTGNVLTIGNAKYVSKQGDTMTGALTINIQGGTLQSIGLEVINTFSGAQIHAEKNLTSSGIIIAESDMTTLGTFLSRYGMRFLSGALMNEMSGFNDMINIQTGNLGTKGITRLTNEGNLRNIGSMQAGEGHFRTGGTFATKVDYTVETGPIPIAAGDLNGDGYADVIAPASGAAGTTIAVLMNKGNGTFNTKVAYTTGTGPRAVAIGDLDGDGKQDIVTANYYTTNASVLLNTGTGTFKAKVDYTVGSQPSGATIGDVNGDGKADIVITNSNSNTVSLLINNGNGTFATAVSYATGTTPYGGAIADLNGDGKPEIMVANFGTTTVSVLPNLGNGLFGTKVDYTASTSPVSVSAGDVNGDKKPDLIVANNAGTTFSVLMNNGNGVFNAAVNYATGTAPRSTSLADFNGDGYLDVAIPNTTSATLSIFFNNGNGTFQAKVDYATSASPRGADVADFNGDGMPDVVVNGNTSAVASIFLNNTKTTLYAASGTGGVVGIGTATPGSKLSVSGSVIINPNGRLANGSAHPGVALEVVGTISGTTVYANQALRSSGSITAEGAISGASLYIGTSIKGAGLVSDCTAATSALQWTASTGRFSCGTISASSIPEVGTTSFTSAVLTIGGARYVEINGDSMTGSLQTPSMNLSGVLLTSLNGFNEALNLNNAGLATYGITRMTAEGNLTNIGSIQSGQIRSTQGGTFAAKVDYTSGTSARGIAIGDISGDGKADMVVANFGSTNMSVFINTGTGTFKPKRDYTTGSGPNAVAIGDLNGDGRADLVVSNISATTVSVFMNTGTGAFAAKTDYTAGTGPAWSIIGDLNGDGKNDIAAANSGGSNVSILLNRGNGTFATAVNYTTGSAPQAVAAGDFNGDGRLDLVTANYSSTNISILLNKGNGTFATKVDYTAGSLPYAIAVGDVTGDTRADIVSVSEGASFVSVYRNTGSGSFAAKVDYATPTGSYGVALGDVTGDGMLDIATANNGTSNASVFINKGTGTFNTKVDYAVGSTPLGIAMGDLNGDGRIDIATANNGGGGASVLMNNATTVFYASAGTGGYVGIGTERMKAKLNVSSTVGVSTGAYIYGSGTVLALDAYTNSGAKTPHLLFGYRGTFDTRITRTSSGALTFASNTGVLLTLNTERADATGNVFQIISDATTSYGGPDENKVFRIQANGATFADGAYTSNGADYAEWFYSGNEKLKPGEVVCIDITKNNAVKRCINQADANVMGIVSTNPAFIGNGITGADGIIPPGYALIGLIGQVPTKVIVSGTGSIRPGDALTPASTPGYARKAMPGESTVGVALEGMTSGEGIINVLISRRNSSMTVDAVGQKVLDTIASMKIGDEVQLMVASSLENLNVDDQIQTEVRTQVSNLKNYDADIQSLQTEIDDMKNQLATLLSQTGSTTIVTTTGSSLAADLTAATLVLEQTLSTGGDARIGGDLHLDGALMASSLFVPNGLSIDGGATVTGTVAATSIRASSGATIDGTMTVNGDIRIHSGSLLFDSGATLSLSDLVVEKSLIILGSITIDGLAEFFGNVIIHGELILNSKQAGFALIPKTGTSVTVVFGSGGLSGTPVVTASPDTPVLYGVKNATQSGFTINLAGPATADIRFSWIAIVTDNARTQTGSVVRDTSMIFPMGSDNIPVSSNMYWNACIRNVAILDADGKPHSCARYHQDYTWTQPDLLIDFLWNTAVTPPLLHLPDGYTVEITEDEKGIRDAFTFGTNEVATDESSLPAPEEETETLENAAPDTPASSAEDESVTPPAESETPATETPTDTIETEPTPIDASEPPASSPSSIDTLTINPVTTEPTSEESTPEPAPAPQSEPTPEPTPQSEPTPEPAPAPVVTE